MTFDDVAGLLGEPRARQLREITLAVYARGAELAERAGRAARGTPRSSWAWTLPAGVVLADEVLTPDSSRFWPADQWQPGRSQPSYDKQFVRDWLTSPSRRVGSAERRRAAPLAGRGRRGYARPLHPGVRVVDGPKLRRLAGRWDPNACGPETPQAG